jgi:hypothetical protein
MAIELLYKSAPPMMTIYRHLQEICLLLHRLYRLIAVISEEHSR